MSGTAKTRPAATVVTTIAAVVISAVVVAASSVMGVRSYYLGATVIIVCAMAPFAVSFEARKPRAREVVLLAVMCALAVASRVVFMWAPNFKPMAAIVMITGMALGPQCGFLAGAISVLASNFLFGQGYWTPWQMLAFGLAGLVFGMLGKSKAFRVPLSVGKAAALAGIGAVFVVLVVGPVLDTSSLLMISSRMTVEGALAVYLAGVPMNVVHAVATAVALFLLAGPILGKIARVKRKFGLFAG